MAFVVKDRVKVSTTTTGTGTLTLGSAATGYQSFSVIGDGNTTYYAIVDGATGAWEVGIGTYTAAGTTLARTTVLSSSNANAPVSFAAGSKDVFVTYPASALYDGAAFYQNVFNGIATALNTQTFNASGTWTKPTLGSVAMVEVWGAGGSGGRNSTSASGGAGGGYRAYLFSLSSLPATVTITVGAGGAGRTGSNQSGAAGGTSSFGSIFTATGGAGGIAGTGGSTGGTSTFPGAPYYVDSAFTFPTSTAGTTGRAFSESGGNGSIGTAGSTRSAGASGGGNTFSVCTGTTSTPGGTSTFGGNGSAAGTTSLAGTQPGGGSGGAGTTSGAGGDGRVKVTVY